MNNDEIVMVQDFCSGKGNIPFNSPLYHELTAIGDHIIAPKNDNFTPSSRTPWGGITIINNYKRDLAIASKEIVGESWEISGHHSFPNIIIKNGIEIPLTALDRLIPEKLYGDTLHSMPFLVKLINSGSWEEYRSILSEIIDISSLNNDEIHRFLSSIDDETIGALHDEMLSKNLSVQVHPKKGDFADIPSKTEAWVVLDAEKGSGIYLGIKECVTKELFEEHMLSGDDISALLNFTEVTAGDVYFIPAGTLHAIGAGITLLEVQETSEATFRAYDWGRRDVNGMPRQLHYDKTLLSATWSGPHGTDLIAALKKTSVRVDTIVENLITAEEFSVNRLTLSKEMEYNGNSKTTGIQGLTVVDGVVEAFINNHSEGVFRKGQSFLIPAALGAYSLKATEGTTVLIQTTT